MNPAVKLRGHNLISLEIVLFKDKAPKTDFEIKVDAMLGNLLKNEDQSVMLVDGPDPICRICPDNMACSVSIQRHSIVAKAYGFEIGKPYTVKELITGLTAYHEKYTVPYRQGLTP
ncbi:MAG: DUF1284 domain-containing protein [DPANN group archaeon]|nr:DUF1284 domain-containing protein [DPANN group archaeon]